MQKSLEPDQEYDEEGRVAEVFEKEDSCRIKKRNLESEGLIIKVAAEGTSKDVEARGSVQNLRIVSYVRKTSEEKEKKYEEYATRRMREI